MALSKYIRDLLYRYDLVVIPNLGGLLTRPESARIDTQTDTFYPPSKQLAFNAKLTENDGLLAHHIASLDKIPYETALNFINFEVTEIKEKLKEQDVSFEGIGAFSLNSEDRIVFEPHPGANFLTESFGLSAINSPSVIREESKEAIGETNEFEFESILDIIVNDEVYINTETVRTLHPILKYAALALVLVGLGYLFKDTLVPGLNSENKIVNQEIDKNLQGLQEATFEIKTPLPEININVTSTHKSEKFKDNLKGSQEKVIVPPTTKVVDTKVVVPEKVVVQSKENTKAIAGDHIPANYEYHSSNKFHIIAGAFKESANARKKIDQLKAKGYKHASILGMNKWNLTQVAFGSYATKREAINVLLKIQKIEDKDAWLLVK